MTIALTLTLQEEFLSNFTQGRSAGANQLSDGSIVVNRLRGSTLGTTTAEFYRSTDDGLTWTFQSDFPSGGILENMLAATLPGNVYLFPQAIFDTNEGSIMRSTDGCATWTTAIDFNPGGGGLELIQPCGVMAYDRNNAWAYGLLQRTNPSGVYAEWAYSTNNGASFTIIPGSGVGTPGDRTFPVLNAGSGKWILGHDRENFWTTTNSGTTWTAAGAMSPPPSTSETRARAATWLTNTIVLAGGSISSTGDRFFPWLWRSTNSGATWTHIDAANIEDWPTSNSEAQVVELKRLTRDAAIMGLGRNFAGGLNPWRVSFDGGLTWQKPTTIGDPWTSSNPTANGGIITTHRGTIIATLNNRTTSGNKFQIWRGQITC